jgi:hypothetical protein
MADRPGGRSFGSASAYGTGVPPAFGHGLGPAAASRPGTLQHGSERSISGSSGESQQRTHRHGAGAPGGAWHQLTPVCADPGACRCPPSAESTPREQSYVELTPEELLAWQEQIDHEQQRLSVAIAQKQQAQLGRRAANIGSTSGAAQITPGSGSASDACAGCSTCEPATASHANGTPATGLPIEIVGAVHTLQSFLATFQGAAGGAPTGGSVTPIQDLGGALQGAAGASNSPQSVHSASRSAQGGSATGEAAAPTGAPASAGKGPGQGGKEAKTPSSSAKEPKERSTKAKRRTKSRVEEESSCPSLSEGSSSESESESEESEDSEHESRRRGKMKYHIPGMSSKRLEKLEADSDPRGTLQLQQQSFIAALTRHHPRLGRVLAATPERWSAMKSHPKYKAANKVIAGIWHDTRKPSSIHVSNLLRRIPARKLNDGRFILKAELESKKVQLGGQVVAAEAEFEKLSFGKAKTLAEVQNTSEKMQSEYLMLPGKDGRVATRTEIQLMLINKIPEALAEQRQALKVEFLQREIEGVVWSVEIIENKIGLIISNHVSASAHAGQHGKGGGKGGERHEGERVEKCHNCGKKGHQARECTKRGPCGVRSCPCCHGGECLIQKNKKIVAKGAGATKAKNGTGALLPEWVLKALIAEHKKVKPNLYADANAAAEQAEEVAEGGAEAEASVASRSTAIHSAASEGPRLSASCAQGAASTTGRGRGLFGAHLPGGRGRGMGRGGPMQGGGKGRGGTQPPWSQASGSALRRTLADMERDMGRSRFADGEEGSERDEGSSGSESESSRGSWSAVTRPRRADQPIGGQVRILPGAASSEASARRQAQEDADRELAQRLELEQQAEAASRERAARVERKLEESRIKRAAARGCLELSDEALRVSVEDASEWPELPKPSLGSSLCPKAFVPTRHVPPVNRAMSKSAQRKANAAARYSQDGQSRRSSDVA